MVHTMDTTRQRYKIDHGIWRQMFRSTVNSLWEIVATEDTASPGHVDGVSREG